MSRTTPEPIEVLNHAHDVGLEKLEALARAVNGLNGATTGASLGQIREVLHFFETDLRVHFRHEEEAVFPELATIIGWEGPLRAMTGEHQSLWKAVDALNQKVEELEGATPESAPAIVKEVKLVSSHIIGVLSSHIGKEDSMLISMAEDRLTEQQMKDLGDKMKAIG